MANTLKGFRLPDETLRQLEWLIAHGHGNQSQVVVKALDRLYQAERPAPPAAVPVAMTERQCHDCGVALDEYDGGRFCVECLRAATAPPAAGAQKLPWTECEEVVERGRRKRAQEQEEEESDV